MEDNVKLNCAKRNQPSIFSKTTSTNQVNSCSSVPRPAILAPLPRIQVRSKAWLIGTNYKKLPRYFLRSLQTGPRQSTPDRYPRSKISRLSEKRQAISWTRCPRRGRVRFFHFSSSPFFLPSSLALFFPERGLGPRRPWKINWPLLSIDSPDVVSCPVLNAPSALHRPYPRDPPPPAPLSSNNQPTLCWRAHHDEWRHVLLGLISAKQDFESSLSVIHRSLRAGRRGYARFGSWDRGWFHD